MIAVSGRTNYTNGVRMKDSVCRFFPALCAMFVSNLAFADNDLSADTKIFFNQPVIAFVNIEGVDRMPDAKTDDFKAWFEYRDANGVYFKKRVILNAQGNSSLAYAKKNFAVDFCEDEWIGDETCDITIGNWVKQDSFHFKAYWLDTFRGGLAVAMGYKFYEDMVADEPRFQERAGLSSFTSKALCHPDGFPCVVSLNGEFYGLFSWQLKKHRRNMDMAKDNPQHVHFELTNYTNSLKSGIVLWDDIEVKNPKTLTDESKGYIDSFAKYNLELEKLRQSLSKEEMRAEIEKRYDVRSVIDYIIHGLLTSNVDGFGKNIQFFTYDGRKWFCSPYDLDLTYGTLWTLDFQFPADWSFFNTDYRLIPYISSDVPFRWIVMYFWDEVKERYAFLRRNRVVNVSSMMSRLKEWNDRIGRQFFEQEYAKWPDSPCIKERILNEGWESVESWKEYYTTGAYDENKTYNQGDMCVYNYHVYKAIGSHKGVPPISKGGFTDNEERVRGWLERRIELEDDYLEFSPTNISFPVSHPAANVRKCLSDGRLFIVRDSVKYGVDGVKYR